MGDTMTLFVRDWPDFETDVNNTIVIITDDDAPVMNGTTRAIILNIYDNPKGENKLFDKQYVQALRFDIGSDEVWLMGSYVNSLEYGVRTELGGWLSGLMMEQGCDNIQFVMDNVATKNRAIIDEAIAGISFSRWSIPYRYSYDDNVSSDTIKYTYVDLGTMFLAARMDPFTDRHAFSGLDDPAGDYGNMIGLINATMFSRECYKKLLFKTRNSIPVINVPEIKKEGDADGGNS